MDKSDKVHPSIYHKTEDNPLVSHSGLKQIFKNEFTYQIISFNYFLVTNVLAFSYYRIVRKLKKYLEKQVSLRIDFNPLLMFLLGLIFCSVISRLSG